MADKTAKTSHPIHPLLSQRWSPRAFADRPVEPARLVALLEAARWAPSSTTNSPGTSSSLRKTRPSRSTGSWAAYRAAMPAGPAKPRCSCWRWPSWWTKTEIPTDTPSTTLGRPWRRWPCRRSTGTVHAQMAGFDVEKAQQVFAIPAQFEPAAAIAWASSATRLVYPSAIGRVRDGRAAARPWPSLSSPASGAKPRRWSSLSRLPASTVP